MHKAAWWLVGPFLLGGCGQAPPSARSVDTKGPLIKAGSILDGAKLVHRVKPLYPRQARQERVKGTIRLRAVITRSGELRDIQVLSGHPLLRAAAVEAVRQWRYEPACLVKGTPVEAITVIDVQFPPSP